MLNLFVEGGGGGGGTVDVVTPLNTQYSGLLSLVSPISVKLPDT